MAWLLGRMWNIHPIESWLWFYSLKYYFINDSFTALVCQTLNVPAVLTCKHDIIAGYDLRLVYGECNNGAQFFRDLDVIEGVAIRWTRDVNLFIKHAFGVRGSGGNRD